MTKANETFQKVRPLTRDVKGDFEKPSSHARFVRHIHLNAVAHRCQPASVVLRRRWYDLLVILDDATSEIYYVQLVEEESTRTVMTAYASDLHSADNTLPHNLTLVTRDIESVAIAGVVVFDDRRKLTDRVPGFTIQRAALSINHDLRPAPRKRESAEKGRSNLGFAPRDRTIGTKEKGIIRRADIVMPRASSSADEFKAVAVVCELASRVWAV